MTTTVTFRLALLSLAALPACGAPPATDSNAGLTAELTRVAERFRSEHDLPGLAVGVMKGGVVVLRRGFGTTRVGGGDSVTSQTIFHLASITKPFVATAVLQLVERGDVDLDAPLRAYLPGFRIQGAGADGITVRQTLSHTAGFPDVTDYAWDRPEYDDGALARWVATLADSTLIGPPGGQWQYSNIGFEVLAHLVATVAGEPFEDYVQANILTPLVMRKSTVLMTDVDSTLLAFGSETDSTGAFVPTAAYPYNRRHAGSSTLHSNVDDMIRWARANFHHGYLEGVSILDPTSYERLWHPERDITEDLRARLGGELPYSKVEQALSWFLFTWQGHRLVNHSGGDLGFRSDLILVPEETTAVIVLMNGGGDARALATELLGLVVGPGTP
ncbi:MAG: serine hydrolase domain-containing protein [Gemmatimonadales bacterium]